MIIEEYGNWELVVGQENTLGKDNLVTLWSRVALAKILMKQKDGANADSLSKSASEIQTTEYGIQACRLTG